MDYAKAIAAKFKAGVTVECIDPGYDDAWYLPLGIYTVASVEAPNLALVGQPMRYGGRRFKRIETISSAT